jgi:hypothetical protein
MANFLYFIFIITDNGELFTLKFLLLLTMANYLYFIIIIIDNDELIKFYYY